MVRKKTASNLKIKIYNESLPRRKKCIYWKKICIEKKRQTLSYQLKKIKRHTNGWSKKKNTVRVFGLLSYNTKVKNY